MAWCCKVWLLMSLMAFSVLSYGSESTPCPDALRSAVGKHFRVGGEKVSERCVVWSYDTNLLLSMFVYDLYPEDSDGRKRVILAVYDQKDRQVSNVYSYDIYEDSEIRVAPFSLRFDTGKYDLAKGVRAFGVRFYSAGAGSGAADHSYGDELTLYVRKGNVLQQVFSQSMSYVALDEGCMKCGEHNKGKEGSLTLNVLPTYTNGFHDLQLVDVATQIGGADGGKKSVTRSTLKFNGETYVSPNWFNFMESKP